MKPSIRRMLFALGVGVFLQLSGCGGGEGTDTSALSTPSHLEGQTTTEGLSSLGQGGAVENVQAPDLKPHAALPEAGVGTIKWNPGHYVVFGSDATVSDIDTGLNEIRDLRFVRGVVQRLFWRQLEPERGVYDFRPIDQLLHKAAADRKRVFVLLGTRFYLEGRVAPDYLRVPLYDGGIYRFTGFKGKVGESITLWDDNTRRRLVLLIQALAERYDGHPNFEGLILNETSFGQPLDEVTEEEKAAYYANLILVDSAARRAFQRTVVIQFVNFPYPRTVPVFDNMLRKGLGFGAPDVFVNDPDSEKYVYQFNEQAKGKIPIGMQVEQDSYYAPAGGAPFDPPPVRDLYLFARDRLYSNYVFWQRDLREPYRAWDRVLQMFRSSWFPPGPAGGLEKQCPASYARCVTSAP